jgi:uncharacterized membrane protein
MFTPQRRKLYYHLLVCLSLSVVIFSFSPLVLSEGKTKPTLLEMPYTLWISILATLILVFFTYLGGRLRGDRGDFS